MTDDESARLGLGLEAVRGFDDELVQRIVNVPALPIATYRPGFAAHWTGHANTTPGRTRQPAYLATRSAPHT